MTRTQWRRHQRNKKVTSEAANASKNNNVKALTDRKNEKKHVKQILFPPLPLVVENEPKVSIGSDEEIASNDFDYGLEGELDIICNMIYVIPLEYDTVTEVTEEEDVFTEEIATHKPLCYYMMHHGSVNKDKAIFERPDMSM